MLLQETLDLDKFLRWCDVAFVVFSITSQNSYIRAREYLECISSAQKSLPKDIPLTLIGNKVDLEQYR